MRSRASIVFVLISLASIVLAADALEKYRVTPSDADPSIHRFDDPHYIVVDREAPPSDLLLFMVGSGAKPGNVSEFIDIAAALGYRAISISYNDLPAVIAVCPRD